MNFFKQHNGELWAEEVPLQEVARQFGTPCYLYSRAALTDLKAVEGISAQMAKLIYDHFHENQLPT